MPGWLMLAAERASSSRRDCASEVSEAPPSTLTATSRLSSESWARYTIPVPPRPSSVKSW